MKIFVSKSFVSNCEKSILKRDNIILINSKIFQQIFNLLINDEIIDKNIIYTNITWILDKRNYQGIFLEDKNIFVYFTQLLGPNKKPKSRNTFVSQNFNPIQKIANESDSYVSLSINPFDLGVKIEYPKTIIKDFKTLFTLGVVINKSINIDTKGLSFNNIDEYINVRNYLKSKNLFNNSTYIKKFDFLNTIAIYANMDGASGMDAYNSMRIINKFRPELQNIDNYWFFNIGKNKITNKQLSEIKDKYNFEYQENDILKEDFIFNDKKEDNLNNIENLLKRNQPFFIKNILKKYISLDSAKCFCCNYNIFSNLIASHIHRYIDIINEFKNKKITLEDAKENIVSGENGFMLCPNHDREFEKGYIYFDCNLGIMVPSNNLDLNNIEFIKKLILMKKIDQNLITDKLKENANKHRLRTNN